MTVIDAVIDRLKWEEGWSPTAYIDTTGNITIGYGTNLGKLVTAGTSVKLIPVQRIEKEDGERFLRRGVENVLRRLEGLPIWNRLNPARQVVIADMAYNMGPAFVIDGDPGCWPIFIGQLKRGDWEGAARNMRSTKWYQDVHARRADPLIAIMRSGELA